jgi:hypothetical protein
MSHGNGTSLNVDIRWVLVALLTACGGGGGTPSACDAYLSCLQTVAAAAGDSTTYDAAKSAYGSSSACHFNAQAEQLCEQSCQQGLDALKASGQSCASTSSQGPVVRSDGGTSDGGTSSVATSDGSTSTGSTCVSTNPCASSETDCTVGERCNTALDPPRCQTLYCGALGTPCADDGDDAYALCAAQACTNGACGDSVVPPPSSTVTLDCRGLVTCFEGCADTSCEQNCATEAPSSVTNSSYTGVYDQALGCVETYCLGTTTSPYKCAVSSDGTQLTEIGGGTLTYASDGEPTSACAICLNDAAAALFGGACVAATSPDCDLTSGSAAQLACATAIAACN